MVFKMSFRHNKAVIVLGLLHFQFVTKHQALIMNHQSSNSMQRTSGPQPIARWIRHNKTSLLSLFLNRWGLEEARWPNACGAWSLQYFVHGSAHLEERIGNDHNSSENTLFQFFQTSACYSTLHDTFECQRTPRTQHYLETVICCSSVYSYTYKTEYCWRCCLSLLVSLLLGCHDNIYHYNYWKNITRD